MKRSPFYEQNGKYLTPTDLAQTTDSGINNNNNTKLIRNLGDKMSVANTKIF